MDDEVRLSIVRQAFAQRLSFVLGLDPRLEAALASVRREDFLEQGTWLTYLWRHKRQGEYIATPSADPAWLYIDNIVAILPERHLNNGQPSAHAKLIGEAAIREGEHVVRVGSGTGYYTAIMAELAGPSGKVTAIERRGRRLQRRGFAPPVAKMRAMSKRDLCRFVGWLGEINGASAPIIPIREPAPMMSDPTVDDVLRAPQFRGPGVASPVARPSAPTPSPMPAMRQPAAALRPSTAGSVRKLPNRSREN